MKRLPVWSSVHRRKALSNRRPFVTLKMLSLGGKKKSLFTLKSIEANLCERSFRFATPLFRAPFSAASLDGRSIAAHVKGKQWTSENVRAEPLVGFSAQPITNSRPISAATTRRCRQHPLSLASGR